jgi:tetratricopeptide (TPR) repeat protein
MQNKEILNITDKINDFVQKNRIMIFIVIGVIVLLFAGLIAFLSISEYLNKKAIAEVEELTERFEGIRISIDDENYQNDVNALLAELEAFAGKNSGFPGSKAWSLAANIYSIRNEWQKAEESWLNSARTGNKTYLAPIAFFQAAVAAEEQNKLEQAISYLQQCVSHSFEFPDAPRAQFNIGRLYEQLGNIPAALEAYRAVLINWQWSETLNPNMLVWQNFARNQIIKLEVR